MKNLKMVTFLYQKIQITVAILLMFIALGCQTLTHSIKNSLGQTESKREFTLKSVWARRTALVEDIAFRPFHIASPALYKDTVIVGNSLDSVTSYSREDGSEIWKYLTKFGSDSGIAVADSRIYFGTNTGELISLDVNSGRKVWSYDLKSESFAPPTISENFLYQTTADGRLFAFEAVSGKMLWNFTRSTETNLTTRVAAQIVVSGTSLYAAFPNGSVVKLNRAAGVVEWEIKLPGGTRFKDVDTAPVIINDLVIVAGYESGLHALDKASGQIVWKSEEPGYVAPAVADGFLYFPNLNGDLLKIEPSSGKTVASFNFKNSLLTTPIISNGLIIFGRAPGAVTVLELSTGKSLAEFDTGHGVSAKPAFDPETQELYVLTNMANLFKLKMGWQRVTQSLPWETK